nr:unnamed protein product [Callosobruchus analis]
MNFLVQFDDGGYFICPKSKIINQSENKEELRRIQKCYENGNIHSTDQLHSKTKTLLKVNDVRDDNNPVTSTVEKPSLCGETYFENAEKAPDFSNDLQPENELSSRHSSTEKSAIDTVDTPVKYFVKPEENKINIISVEILKPSEKEYCNLENTASTTNGQLSGENSKNDIIENTDSNLNIFCDNFENSEDFEDYFQESGSEYQPDSSDEESSVCSSSSIASGVLPTTPNPTQEFVSRK